MESNIKKNLLSDTITWLRFPLILMIILLHCYSTIKLPGEHEIYFKILYPFSLWLGESGVPGYFFISGFLFFLSKKSYQQKLETRLHTLFIPYLLWNTLILGLYVIAFVVGYPMDINGKNISDYTASDYLRAFWDRGSFDNGNFVPILCPFWYIRNLLIMSILSPLLYYLIKYLKGFFLMSVAIWWLFTPHNAFIPQTILFFCTGAYFSIIDKNPLVYFSRYKVLLIGCCIIFAISDIFTHTINSTCLNLQIHRIALIFNIPVLFLLAEYYCLQGHKLKYLSNTAFIVFCTHYPIIAIIRKACAARLGYASDLIHIPLYFFCVIITTFTSIMIYISLDRYCPKIKKILSGNR